MLAHEGNIPEASMLQVTYAHVQFVYEQFLKPVYM